MSLSNGGEALSVQGNRPERPQGGAVGGGAVALVSMEGVVRKATAQLSHEAVAGDLGADRGGSDSQAGGVGPDDGRLPVGKAAGGVQRKRVHDDVIGIEPEAAEGAVHGEATSGGNAGRIDFSRRGVRDPDRGGAGVNQAGQALAGAGREALGVGDAGQQLPIQIGHRREDDGRGGQRPRPGATAGFVHARDSAASLPQQPEFPARRWEPEREVADGAGLSRRLGAPLLDARGAAGPVAQVVELGAPNLAVANHLDVVDDR